MVIVSVIITAHKQSPYLDKCIESVLHQSLDRNEYQIILASDNCVELKEMADKYNIDFSLLPEKGNFSKSFNHAVKNYAQGEYLKVVAYDDWLHFTALQTLLNGIQNQKVDLICADAFNVMKDGSQVLYRQRDRRFTLNKMLIGNYIHGGTIMIRKSVFNKIGGYREELPNAEEYDLYCRLLYHGYRIGYTSGTVYYYRYHDQQKSDPDYSSVTDLSEERQFAWNMREQVVADIKARYKN